MKKYLDEDGLLQVVQNIKTKEDEQTEKLKEYADSLVCDSLESDRGDLALSAKQGKILLGKITDLNLSVYQPKGSVQNLADLPIDNLRVGYVYNIVNPFYIEDERYPAGTNIVWTGISWDPLGGTVDFSDYSTTEEVEDMIQDLGTSKVDKVEGKSLILDSEIEKLAGLPNNTELTNSITKAKAAGDNAQSDLDAHKLNVSNPHKVTKDQVGLGSVTNDAQVKRSEMGVSGGVATLDTTGKVPESQLPSYVDDVLEFNNTTMFPSTGESGKIYVALDTNLTYRWGGTQYVEISKSLALGETFSTAYPGDKGKAATDNINKVKSTALSHIDDTTPVTYNTSKVTINYECYEGDQYGSAGTKHGADIAAASETTAGVMTAVDKSKFNAIEAGAQVNVIESIKVNGTAQAISNKEIDILVPTKISQLTNDIYEVATSEEITAILN